jgi:hypothetical protein
MELEHTSYDFAHIGEPHDKMLKVTQDKEEFMVPNPSLYVTRVIAPEEEVKRRVRAKELADILKMQMQQKKEREAREKKEEMQKDIDAEERFNKQFKEPEKHIGINRVNPNVMSFPSLPRVAPEVIETPKKPVIKEESRSSFERKYGTSEREPYERQIFPVTSSVPLEIEYKIPYYDNELQKLQRELHEKNIEFNNTLYKLKDDFFSISNSKSNIEKELNAVKNYIKKQPEYNGNFNTLNTSSHIQLPAIYKRREKGMGRYSKFYFTAYKPLVNKTHFNKTTKPKLLEGESRLVAWKETTERARTVDKKTNTKEEYNTLDDLINGFLSDTHNAPLNEIPITIEHKDVQLSTEDLRENKAEEKDMEVLLDALDVVE